MAEDETFETTAEHFAMFEEEVALWIERFGLKSWQLFIEHVDCGDLGTRARVHWSLGQRQAKIKLNKVCNSAASETNVRVAAFHEVCELFFSDLTSELWLTRSDAFVDALTHGLIRTLENVVWWPDWKARKR
ncbi:MAG: hypothetical protein AAGU21_01010 [Solidesulfovibrio sp.]|uniref:hypothetical protein n=1 Tax=Solidesulfovibrio sp. TaxID=2910990 RepID=UPI00315912B7